MSWIALLTKNEPTVHEMFLIFLSGVAAGLVIFFTLILIRDGSAVMFV